MKEWIGRAITIESGWSMGLDIPAGEAKITSVCTIEDNYSIKDSAERYIAPIMPTFEDMLMVSKNTIMDTMEVITDYMNGNWVCFYYTSRELDERYGSIVLPQSDFIQLLSQKDFDNLVDNIGGNEDVE